MLQKIAYHDLLLSGCDSDTEQREYCDNNNGDRNHKHHRRERDLVDQVPFNPNKKRNVPFENEYTCRENNSQSSVTWKKTDAFSPSTQPPYRNNQQFSIDPWLSSVDIASQMVPPGSPLPSFLKRRGLSVNTNQHGPSWSSYRVMRPSVSHLNFTREICRDFEERGFCLRGDMCTMDHGVSRIVVEDVQSLSQFNLPVSHPSGLTLKSSSALPSISTSSSSVMNSKDLHHRSRNPRIADGQLSIGISTFSASVDEADFYNPDQPLWANDCPSKLEETECVYQGTSSAICENVSLNEKSETKGRFVSIVSSSHSDSNKAKQCQDISADVEIRKPTQKASRTLFVSGIPRPCRKTEALLSHFKRFGEVIDIYIPPNGRRAFIQFSKREEAEDALKAPDAVMGNRFIKLMWASRDRITDDVPNSDNDVSLKSSLAITITAQKGKDYLQPAVVKSSFNSTTVSRVPRIDIPKPGVPNLSKVSPYSLKKPGNSAFLEEFRKRQDSFAQKRVALQRELAEMVKKAAGSKGEVASEQVAKRQKVENISDIAKAEIPNSSNSGAKMASLKAEGGAQNTSVDLNVDKSTLNPIRKLELHEPRSVKKSIRPLTPPGRPFGLNRFKLDNRPVAFKISPPLPTGLENIEVLKEHFSSYGELSSLEIADGNSSDSAAPKNLSALIYFTTHSSAESAFVNGKCWKGQKMQFVWVPSSNFNSKNGNKEKNSSVSEVSTTISAESKCSSLSLISGDL